MSVAQQRWNFPTINSFFSVASEPLSDFNSKAVPALVTYQCITPAKNHRCAAFIFSINNLSTSF